MLSVTMAVLIFLFIFGVFTITNGLAEQNLVYPCTTGDENGEKINGFCVPIFECPEIWKLACKYGDEGINVVKNSVCLVYSNNLLVCCKTPKRHGVKSTTSTYLDFRNILVFKTSTSTTPIPTSTTTTFPTADDNSFAVDQVTAAAMESDEITTEIFAMNGNRNNSLNEREKNMEICGRHASEKMKYPWLVRVNLFANECTKHMQCTGIIIEKTYVLTTSECGYQAESISFTNTNCSQNSYYTEPTSKLYVEKALHSSEIEDDEFSVTLLKLNESIVYNDFVGPICLPLNKTNTKKSFGVIISQDDEDIKTLSFPPICYKSNDNKKMEEVVSEENYYCFSQRNISDDCILDFGGPLIYPNIYNNRWYLDGLISNFKSGKTCSKSDHSGIYLTPSLIDFITKNII